MPRQILRAALVAIVVATLALTPLAKRTASAAAPGAPIGPKTYYLALGDSLAYGLQPNLDDDEGYPQDYFTDLQTHGTQQLADMGCSGETTVTFINGGCPYRLILPPHYDYSGPQLQAALAYLQQYAGQVSPVTIDIGANDLLNALDPSTCTFTALTQTVQTIYTNVQSILSQLQTALHGSGDLVTMTYYFPYQNQCPSLVPVVQSLNDHITAIAHQNGALVAQVFGAFGGPTTPNPNLCIYTWICESNTFLPCILVPSLCIHATTLGYKVIANTYEAITGY